MIIGNIAGIVGRFRSNPPASPSQKLMYPEHERKEKIVTNSAKFIKTKKPLLDLFRPTAPPTPETPARTTPDEIQSDEEPPKFGVRGSGRSE
jgi:hypothetical protein